MLKTTVTGMLLGCVAAGPEPSNQMRALWSVSKSLPAAGPRATVALMGVVCGTLDYGVFIAAARHVGTPVATALRWLRAIPQKS